MPAIYTHCAAPKCENITVPFIHNIASGRWRGFRDKVASLRDAHCDDYILFLDSDVLIHVRTNERKIHHTARELLQNNNLIFGAERGNFEIAAPPEYYVKKWRSEGRCTDRKSLDEWVHCKSSPGPCHSSKMPLFFNSGFILGRCRNIKAITESVLRHSFYRGDQYYYNKEALNVRGWSLDYCSKMVTNLHQMDPRVANHAYSHFYHANGRAKKANLSTITTAKFIDSVLQRKHRWSRPIQ